MGGDQFVVNQQKGGVYKGHRVQNEHNFSDYVITILDPPLPSTRVGFGHIMGQIDWAGAALEEVLWFVKLLLFLATDSP